MEDIDVRRKPENALQALKDGNARFRANSQMNRDLMQEVKATSGGQTPVATVLHCIDSRVSAELLFDQGVGDVFSIRIAGNFVNDDILGSMGFACAIAKTRLLAVIGHTACGAVKGAVDNAKLGNLTGMLDKIQPAVEGVAEPSSPADRTSANIDFVNEVAKKNVELTIANIRKRSQVLADLESHPDPDVRIQIVGGMYDICDGSVTFYE